MKKQILGIALALVMVFSFTLVTASPATAADLEVGPGKIYTTIASAVAAATGGDTILVYTDTYYEHVVINKALTIKAATGESPIIDGSGSGTCFGIYNGAGLSDVTIEGIEIQNAVYGIWIYGSPSTYSNITITDNNIHNHSQNGILVTDCTVNGLTISGNSVDSSGIGISFANNSTIDGLNCENNVVTNNNAGLSLIVGTFSNITVSSCYFEGNAWEHIDLGCWSNFPSLSNVYITGCQFLSGPWCAVYVQSSFGEDDIVLRGNQFLSAYGVFNTMPDSVDAVCNWWNSIDGPGGPCSSGSGTLVTCNVYYEPWWLTSEGPCYGYEGIDDCFQDVKNHGQFVSCIAKFTKDLMKDGTLTEEQREAIIEWAAESDIGK